MQAVEKSYSVTVCVLNVKMIEVARANFEAAFDFALQIATASRRRISAGCGRYTSVNSSRCLTNRLADSLKSMVMLTGIAGEWRQGENLHQSRADSGAVLNWWKSTGTVKIQGPEAAPANLKTAFSKFSGS
jgi:hypothetical protein